MTIVDLFQDSSLSIAVLTYYSGSLTNSKALKTSCKTGFGIKLLPSGSYDLKTRRATSLGVSFDTRFFSLLNSTTNSEKNA